MEKDILIFSMSIYLMLYLRNLDCLLLMFLCPKLHEQIVFYFSLLFLWQNFLFQLPFVLPCCTAPPLKLVDLPGVDKGHIDDALVSARLSIVDFINEIHSLIGA